MINKNLLLSLLFATGLLTGHAQTTPEIELTIDPLTQLPDKYAPFDQQFVLNIPIDSAIQEAEIRDRIGIFQIEKGSTFNNYNEVISSDVVTKLAFLKTKQKYNTLKVLVPPLEPNRDYIFSVQFAFKSTIKLLHAYNDLLVQKVKSEDRKSYFDRIVTLMTDYNEPAVKLFKDALDNPDKVNLLEVNQEVYDAYYTSTIEKDLNDFRGAFLDTDNVAADIENFKQNLVGCPLCPQLMKCNCENSFIVEELKFSLADLLPITCQFGGLLKADITAIATLQTSLDSIANGMASAGSFYRTPAILLTNISKNISYFKAIKRLLKESTMLSLLTDSCRNLLLADLNKIILKLEGRRNKANRHYTNINNNLALIVSQGIVTGGSRRVFIFLHLSAVSTATSTIKTNSGNYFIPEIGLVNMVSNETVGGPTYFVRPYYGINVSFRPINKEIRFKDIRTLANRRGKLVMLGPTIWHRLSISVGVTRYSIATNHPEISDLLKDICVLTGLNCRITRAFRIGAGATWYRRENPNPLLANEITAMPYVSLVLDVDVVNWAKSVTDLFIK